EPPVDCSPACGDEWRTAGTICGTERLASHQLIQMHTLDEHLWGPRARFGSLLAAAAAILLVVLGGRELWTLEARWADICWRMMHSGDYVHPSLGGVTYYDKPLLSYWLIIVTARLIGHLSVWALRLPSVVAGLLALWCTFDIGRQLIDRRTAFLAGW